MKEGENVLHIAQAVLCLGVLAAALVLKTMGGPVYEQARGWYGQQVQATILPDETVKELEQQFYEILPAFSQSQV